MRFAMVTTFYPPYSFGGDGIFVQRLANELAQRGHHVTVIHNADAYLQSTGKEPTATPADHPSITVHRLRRQHRLIPLLAVQQTGRPGFYEAELNRLLGENFDVIHYHNVSLIGGAGVLTLGKAIKLYTLHEYWLVCETHVMYRFGQAACTRRLCTLCALSYGRPPQWWRWGGAIGSAASHVDAFLSPSRFVQQKHQELGFGGSIVSMPHFVPGPAELSTEREATEPYFLFLGRLEHLKGLQTLIPVFRRYPRAKLLVAGTGKMEAELKTLAAGCSNIEFCGHISGARLKVLLQQACALIIPSLNYETGPLVVLEAFSYGTPAIVRDLGSMPDMITESGAGFTYRSDAELIHSMDQLLDSPELRQRLGRLGREAWVARWSPDAHLERYLRLIDDLRQCPDGKRSRAL